MRTGGGISQEDVILRVKDLGQEKLGKLEGQRPPWLDCSG